MLHFAAFSTLLSIPLLFLTILAVIFTVSAFLYGFHCLVCWPEKPPVQTSWLSQWLMQDWHQILCQLQLSCKIFVKYSNKNLVTDIFIPADIEFTMLREFIQSPHQSPFFSLDQGTRWWDHAWFSIMFLWGTKYFLNCLNSAKIISMCNVSKNKWPHMFLPCFPSCSAILLVKLCTSPESHKMLLSIRSFSRFVECEVGWGYSSSLGSGYISGYSHNNICLFWV